MLRSLMLLTLLAACGTAHPASSVATAAMVTAAPVARSIMTAPRARPEAGRRSPRPFRSERPTHLCPAAICRSRRSPMTSDPSPGFADLGLSPEVLAAVEAAGYEAPSPIQAVAAKCTSRRFGTRGSCISDRP